LIIHKKSVAKILIWVNLFCRIKKNKAKQPEECKKVIVKQTKKPQSAGVISNIYDDI
jgi:hypothetical protein